MLLTTSKLHDFYIYQGKILFSTTIIKNSFNMICRYNLINHLPFSLNSHTISHLLEMHIPKPFVIYGKQIIFSLRSRHLDSHVWTSYERSPPALSFGRDNTSGNAIKYMSGITYAVCADRRPGSNSVWNIAGDPAPADASAKLTLARRGGRNISK